MSLAWGVGLPSRMLPISGHEIARIRAHQTGRSPIFNRLCFGTTLACECGWRCTVNEAPSAGGTSAVKSLHREHLAELSPEWIVVKLGRDRGHQWFHVDEVRALGLIGDGVSSAEELGDRGISRKALDRLRKRRLVTTSHLSGEPGKRGLVYETHGPDLGAIPEAYWSIHAGENR